MIKRIQFQKSFLLLTFLLSAGLASAQNFAGIPRKQFNPVMSVQRNSQWCWAATIQMVMNYYRIGITQEEIVEETFGLGRGGNLPDLPASHEIVTDNLNITLPNTDGNLMRVKTKMHYGAPDADYLVTTLSAMKPILVAYETGEDTEHAVIITGVQYRQTASGPVIEKVLVRDPSASKQNARNNGEVEYDYRKFCRIVTVYWDIHTGSAGPEFAHMQQDGTLRKSTENISRTEKPSASGMATTKNINNGAASSAPRTAD